MDKPQWFHFYYWFYAVHETKRLTGKNGKAKTEERQGPGGEAVACRQDASTSTHASASALP